MILKSVSKSHQILKKKWRCIIGRLYGKLLRQIPGTTDLYVIDNTSSKLKKLCRLYVQINWNPQESLSPNYNHIAKLVFQESDLFLRRKKINRKSLDIEIPFLNTFFETLKVFCSNFNVWCHISSFNIHEIRCQIHIGRIFLDYRCQINSNGCFRI